MKQRRLGTTELHVSEVGLGCNNFGGRLDRAASIKVVHAALDAGITLFDTADIYGQRGGSETILGEALGARRKDIVLVTKFGVAMDDEGRLKGGSARYVVSAIEASLKRLKTDWIDLYFLHRPDPKTPIEETLRALDQLIAQGKVRYIGCSNFSGGAGRRSGTRRKRQGAQPVCRLRGSVQSFVAADRGRTHSRDAALRSDAVALFPAGERHADREIPLRRADPGRHAIVASALFRSLPQRREFPHRRKLARVLRSARPLLARSRLRLAVVEARGRLRDRRRQHAGAGSAKRGGERLAA